MQFEFMNVFKQFFFIVVVERKKNKIKNNNKKNYTHSQAHVRESVDRRQTKSRLVAHNIPSIFIDIYSFLKPVEKGSEWQLKSIINVEKLHNIFFATKRW